MKRKAEEDEQVFKETMPENIPNLLKAKKLKFQGAEWTPSTLNPKKFTMGHIIIRLLKAKSKGTILKADREMVHYFWGNTNPNDRRFLVTREARRNQHAIFKYCKERRVNCKSYIQWEYISSFKGT